MYLIQIKLFLVLTLYLNIRNQPLKALFGIHHSQFLINIRVGFKPLEPMSIVKENISYILLNRCWQRSLFPLL